jgi:predicted DNA-binding protein
MAKRAESKKSNSVQDERAVKAVRLDLTPKDHERLDHQARKRGLTKASYARMIILERLEQEEAGK